jgi:hypothetical protein
MGSQEEKEEHEAGLSEEFGPFYGRQRLKRGSVDRGGRSLAKPSYIASLTMYIG